MPSQSGDEMHSQAQRAAGQAGLPQAAHASRQGRAHWSTPRTSRRTGFIATRSDSGAAARKRPLQAGTGAAAGEPTGCLMRGLLRGAAGAAAQGAKGGDRRRPAAHRAGDAYRMVRAPHRACDLGVVGIRMRTILLPLSPKSLLALYPGYGASVCGLVFASSRATAGKATQLIGALFDVDRLDIGLLSRLRPRPCSVHRAKRPGGAAGS